MTPAAVLWIKVSTIRPQSGALQPVLCFRGETDMVGILGSVPVRVIKRPAKVFDNAPSVHDRREAQDSAPTAPRGMLSYLNTFADMGATEQAARLLAWANGGGFDAPGVLDTSGYESEEPK